MGQDFACSEEGWSGMNPLHLLLRRQHVSVPRPTLARVATTEVLDHFAGFEMGKLRFS